MTNSTTVSPIQYSFWDFKPCPNCGRITLRKNYWKNKHTKDGLQVYCIDCMKTQRQSADWQSYQHDYQRQYRATHHPNRRLYMKTYGKELRQRPEYKAHIREYIKQPQAKALRNKHQNRYIARKNAAPGDHSVAEWEMLCERAGHRCLCCGGETLLTRDHIKPITRGGCNCIHNLQPLCLACNAAKGNRRSTDYRTPEIKAWIATIPHIH